MVHHLRNVAPKEDKARPRMISRMVEVLAAMIKPASPNTETMDRIRGNADNWGFTTLLILEDHYKEELDALLRSFDRTLLPDWKQAFELAARWARRNLPRLEQEVLDYTEAILATGELETEETEERQEEEEDEDDEESEENEGDEEEEDEDSEGEDEEDTREEQREQETRTQRERQVPKERRVVKRQRGIQTSPPPEEVGIPPPRTPSPPPLAPPKRARPYQTPAPPPVTPPTQAWPCQTPTLPAVVTPTWVQPFHISTLPPVAPPTQVQPCHISTPPPVAPSTHTWAHQTPPVAPPTQAQPYHTPTLLPVAPPTQAQPHHTPPLPPMTPPAHTSPPPSLHTVPLDSEEDPDEEFDEDSDEETDISQGQFPLQQLYPYSDPPLGERRFQEPHRAFSPVPGPSRPEESCRIQIHLDTNFELQEEEESEETQGEPSWAAVAPPTPVQLYTPTRHRNSTRKMIDWSLPVTRKWVILGDSNLALMPEFSTPHLQVDSFPGGNFRHAQALLQKSQHLVPAEKVVLAFGINHRSQKVKETAIRQMLAALRTARDRMPHAEIWVPMINFSPALPPGERENIRRMNEYILDHLRFIPPLPYHLFDTQEDLVHWTEDTARNMLKHWFQYLNPEDP